MNTQVFINGLEIDIDPDVVIAAWYGNLNFGQLGKRKGARSNTYSAPFSNRNREVFEGCEQVHSWSNVVYRRGTIVVLIDGSDVFNGWCTIDEAKEEYQISSFATASDFYSQLNNKKLREVDLSAYSHTYSEPVVRNSWNNTSGYIYSFVEYGKEWPFSTIPVDYLKPQIFLKTLILQIVEDAGYSISGEVLTDPIFEKHLVSPSLNPYPYAFGAADVNLALYLPDNMKQSKVWLDFANLYGLQFNVDDQSKEIRCTYIDDLLFNEAEDWTSKVDASEKRRINYRYKDYGQLSYLRYKEMKVQEVLFPDYAQEIVIDDTVLQDTADIYTSEFILIPNASTPTVWNAHMYVAKIGFAGIWNPATAYLAGGGVFAVYYQGTYYKPKADSTGQVPPLSPTYWEVIKEADVWTITPRPMYAMLETDPVFYINVAFSTGNEIITKKTTNNGLKWTEIYPKRYRVLTRILQKTKIVEILLKLNRSDINQLDFTRLKYIDGELYVMQSVDEYKLNAVDSTIVNLVRL